MVFSLFSSFAPFYKKRAFLLALLFTTAHPFFLTGSGQALREVDPINAFGPGLQIAIETNGDGSLITGKQANYSVQVTLENFLKRAPTNQEIQQFIDTAQVPAGSWTGSVPLRQAINIIEISEDLYNQALSQQIRYGDNLDAAKKNALNEAQSTFKELIRTLVLSANNSERFDLTQQDAWKNLTPEHVTCVSNLLTSFDDKQRATIERSWALDQINALGNAVRGSQNVHNLDNFIAEHANAILQDMSQTTIATLDSKDWDSPKALSDLKVSLEGCAVGIAEAALEKKFGKKVMRFTEGEKQSLKDLKSSLKAILLTHEQLPEEVQNAQNLDTLRQIVAKWAQDTAKQLTQDQKNDEVTEAIIKDVMNTSINNLASEPALTLIGYYLKPDNTKRNNINTVFGKHNIKPTAVTNLSNGDATLERMMHAFNYLIQHGDDQEKAIAKDNFYAGVIQPFANPDRRETTHCLDGAKDRVFTGLLRAYDEIADYTKNNSFFTSDHAATWITSLTDQQWRASLSHECLLSVIKDKVPEDSLKGTVLEKKKVPEENKTSITLQEVNKHSTLKSLVEQHVTLETLKKAFKANNWLAAEKELKKTFLLDTYEKKALEHHLQPILETKLQELTKQLTNTP